MSSPKIKNIAVIAHVDHGKTTFVDSVLSQAGVWGERDEVIERVMDSGELEKERGITIKAKNCAIQWKDHKINLLDTPGHADFGGEVERSLMMVDGVLLLVDAAEGPLPQTRFVLQKALEQDIKIAVIINKIDRQDERHEEVQSEIEDLLLDLASMLDKELDLDLPIFYGSGRDGWMSTSPYEKTENLHTVLDFMVTDYFPYPKVRPGNGLQLLITNLAYSPYLGQQLVGRIQRGEINKNQTYVLIGKEKQRNFKATSIKVYHNLGEQDVDTAGPGEVVIVSGIEDINIGDTVASLDNPEALKRIEVDPPTVSVHVSVSTSPFSGKEGDYLTSRQLEEFLQESCKLNVSLKYSPTDDPKVYILKGRGELQLAVVFEELRRKGKEFMLSRPEVLLKEENGEKLEPFERVVLDLPNDHTGVVTETLSKRKGRMENMLPLGENRTRIEFTIPSRGLIGYRSQYLTDTKGEGLMSSYFVGYHPFAGDMLSRQNGAIIADRTGKTTTYALWYLLSSGKQFVKTGEDVYEGMVIGEHTRQNDLNVNAVREKHVSSVRTAGKDENMVLPPIGPRTLDWALDWIAEDEWVEVTPLNIRIRKRELQQSKRTVIRKGN